MLHKQCGSYDSYIQVHDHISLIHLGTCIDNDSASDSDDSDYM